MTKPFAFLSGIIFFCGVTAWAQAPGQAGAGDEQLVRQWVATLGGDAFDFWIKVQVGLGLKQKYTLIRD